MKLSISISEFSNPDFFLRSVSTKGDYYVWSDYHYNIYLPCLTFFLMQKISIIETIKCVAN